MRQAAWQGNTEKRDTLRLCLSVSIPVLVHLGLFALFQIQNIEPLNAEYEVVKVAIISPSATSAEPVILPPAPPDETPKPDLPVPPLVPGPEPQIEIAPEPTAEPDPPPDQAPPAQTPAEPIEPPSPSPVIRPPDGNSQTIQASPVPEGETLIPDRWRLPNGARMPIENTKLSKKSLAHTLDCLKGFRTECAEVRKEIFAEEQLSGTDLVWMANEPHSGLSDSSLYGLSEAEIRERLGIPTAGQNGFAILPGISIDGPLWDRLHGVNKACSYGTGIGASGQRELRKSCAPLRPSSKDRIRFIPKPAE